eukprot:9745432-Heterocapsa_arctica.AAC.1
MQQVERQKQENKRNTDRHRQTLIGDKQTKHTDYQEADKQGPTEDASNMIDGTARQKHDERNTRHNGILYKQEKEDGTRIASTSLS